MNSSLPRFWEHFENSFEIAEESVLDRKGSYKNLSKEALYSSGEDLLTLFTHPSVKGSFADLGCGDGRTCLLYSWLHPSEKAIGIEFEKARLKVGEVILHKESLSNASLIEADLLSCPIPLVKNYFLYFPTGPVLDRVLTTLYKENPSFQLIVIESHGDLMARLDLENWLTIKEEITLKSGRHYPSARIYVRNSEVRDQKLLPFTLTYQDKFLLIEDNGVEWIGETEGMEWTEGERFELSTPPRTISWAQVKRVMAEDELQPYTIPLQLRREGEVEIYAASNVYTGYIRKIIIHPAFQVEISSGQKVEWSSITKITQGNRLCYDTSSFSFS